MADESAISKFKASFKYVHENRTQLNKTGASDRIGELCFSIWTLLLKSVIDTKHNAKTDSYEVTVNLDPLVSNTVIHYWDTDLVVYMNGISYGISYEGSIPTITAGWNWMPGYVQPECMHPSYAVILQKMVEICKDAYDVAQRERMLKVNTIVAGCRGDRIKVSIKSYSSDFLNYLAEISKHPIDYSQFPELSRIETIIEKNKYFLHKRVILHKCEQSIKENIQNEGYAYNSLAGERIGENEVVSGIKVGNKENNVRKHKDKCIIM